MSSVIPILPHDAQARYDTMIRRLTPSARAWVTQEAAKVKATQRTPTVAEFGHVIRARFGMLGGMSNADIEAIVFLVMMQAAKSAQEDLKAIMDGVRHTNQAKQSAQRAGTVRNAPPLSPGPGRPPRALATASGSGSISKAPGSPDAVNGDSSLEQTKAYLQRLTTMLLTMSHAMQRVAETSSTIIGNLK